MIAGTFVVTGASLYEVVLPQGDFIVTAEGPDVGMLVTLSEES